jgi:endonuclease III
MTNYLDEIQVRLIEKAKVHLIEPPQAIGFTGEVAIDNLLNDLSRYPHAFVFACLMDIQSRAKEVWTIPYHLQNRLGSFAFSYLVGLSEEALVIAMCKPKPLHRFPKIMAHRLFVAIRHIENVYNGDASRIWAEKPSSATIVRRFLEFKGIGPKIATMATNILVRDFRIPVSDRYSIDISVDVHVRRVFSRLGFVSDGAKPESIIYTARERYPEYPGIFDLVLWELGQQICRPSPICNSCYLADLCPSALNISGSDVQV